MSEMNAEALLAPRDEESWHRGDWMQLYSGIKFYPMDPKADEINIIDIAHALSLICRYGGHAKYFYSVAEHCVLMSYCVPEEHALWALLHDASEAYVGDMVRPLKHQLPEYMAAEDRVINCIIERYNLDPTPPKCVKEADNRILLNERAAVLVDAGHSWGSSIEDLKPLDIEIQCWDPFGAELMYLQRFKELTYV